MEHHYVNFARFLLCFLQLLHFICATSGLESATVESNRLPLLDFKRQITQDPLQIMSSWNDSTNFCNWVGVECSPVDGRVTILNLQSKKLAGSIPPSIGNLTSLTNINLGNNSFRGQVPEEIGRLQGLQNLTLSDNFFGGKIPTNLSHCTGLKRLDIKYNEFIGQIPDHLSSLLQLEYLGLGTNNLTGSIPAWIGNFSSLQILSLLRNNLEGSIPDELGQISGLQYFQLYGNFLSGTIPPSIYNISSIYYFCVTQNQLHGQLPSDVGLTLPNLELFVGGLNYLTGRIPVSLANASKLQIVDFPENQLTGNIPTNLASLQNLIRLNFEQNRLGKGKIDDLNFITFLANCTNLQELGLRVNGFGGQLPGSIGNLSTQLKSLTLGWNLIYGNIPPEMGNLINLTVLGLEYNNLNGSVPDVIGRLHKLEGLALNYNKFSGSIPSSFGNLTSLTRLFVEGNKFEGSIPPSLGNCQNLLELDLSRNNLNGTIPKQVLGLSSLSVSLSMAHNFLTGSLPLEVGNLINLAELDLSGNNLSGEIPSSLGKCVLLTRLHLGSNMFEGKIPQSLQNLRGLEELDLSSNNLTGQIPEFLGKLVVLRSLNLSFNKLDGEVSKEGIFANASAVSLIGNAKLCGGVPKLLLPVCSRKKPGKLLSRNVIIVLAAVIFMFLLLCCVGIYLIMKKSRRRSTALSASDGQLVLSYWDISKSTNNFSEDNLIGSGSFGSVYKALLPGDRTVVAIKLLNLQQRGASRSFIDECNALKSIRHRNILKIITACSSVDHKGNDFKALVFEFMSKGSLDQWLHSSDEEPCRNKKLSFKQRLNIAIDVASALSYLHHDCETPIIHCDLKPSNVLLDDDMTAHVGDFGLARILFEASDGPSKNQPISVGLKGSIGYIPPEYTGGRVSILGDIYSYGILLLEMFTGKRPTDSAFKDDLSIYNFVLMALPNHVMDIIDPSMFFEGVNDEEVSPNHVEEKAIITDKDPQVNTQSREIEECLVSVMRIGLACSTTSPIERMAMKDILKNLCAIRDSFLRYRNRNGRRLRSGTSAKPKSNKSDRITSSPADTPFLSNLGRRSPN